VIISNRFRLFFDGTFPARFVILMHDMHTVEEAIGVFCVTSSPAKLALAAKSFGDQLLAEGVAALEMEPTAGIKIYSWFALKKFSTSGDVRPKLTPSTPEEFDRWISSVDPPRQR
jgi:hypothetical protein